jgi:metal-responsive CopG/Arc/MetJ family transcriptional regulator
MAQSKYGRPMKGKTRRVPTTVQMPTGILDIIDEYVEKKDAATEGAYSRSDFINEAVKVYMREKGMLPADE